MRLRMLAIGAAQFGWPVPDPCASAIAAFDY